MVSRDQFCQNFISRAVACTLDLIAGTMRALCRKSSRWLAFFAVLAVYQQIVLHVSDSLSHCLQNHEGSQTNIKTYCFFGFW